MLLWNNHNQKSQEEKTQTWVNPSKNRDALKRWFLGENKIIIVFFFHLRNISSNLMDDFQ